jgi:hypothetical protein
MFESVEEITARINSVVDSYHFESNQLLSEYLDTAPVLRPGRQTKAAKAAIAAAEQSYADKRRKAYDRLEEELRPLREALNAVSKT